MHTVTGPSRGFDQLHRNSHRHCRNRHNGTFGFCELHDQLDWCIQSDLCELHSNGRATAGTASCSVTYTPTVAGHHLITGTYQGDSTHAVSQGTFLLAATPAPHSTGTSLQCSPGSVQVSTSSTCTVTVTDTSATPTTPTGTVK